MAGNTVRCLGVRDGQTNWIKIFPVCPSYTPTTTPRARAVPARIGLRDGQTNWIKIIPFVCPSYIPTTTPRARAVPARIGLRDGQTNWIKLSHSSVLHIPLQIETDRRRRPDEAALSIFLQPPSDFPVHISLSHTATRNKARKDTRTSRSFRQKG